jgi:hypothetical protein
MNEEEYGGTPPDGGDRGGSGVDSGLVQPTQPDTYRGPYGEPIVVPVTDDPEGHPDYQPGHSDEKRDCRRVLGHLNYYSRHVFALSDTEPETLVITPPRDSRFYRDGFSYRVRIAVRNGHAHFSNCSFIPHPGSGQSDHGASARGNG